MNRITISYEKTGWTNLALVVDIWKDNKLTSIYPKGELHLVTGDGKVNIEVLG